MTLAEMQALLESRKTEPEKPTTESLEPKFAHEVRKRRSDFDPKVLEQLIKLRCPVCDRELACLHNVPGASWLYTCTEEPALHRWAVLDR